MADGQDSLFQDTRLEPFLDQAEHSRITDPMLQKTDQPLLAGACFAGSHSPWPPPFAPPAPRPLAGACFAGSHSPWPPPFAPPAPRPVARLCSSASLLLLRGLTSHDRASSATAPRLPDADQCRRPPPASRGTSRFPCKELLHSWTQ